MGDDLDLDAIEKRHAPHVLFPGERFCDWCGKKYPCDSAALVRRVRELEAENVQMREWLGWLAENVTPRAAEMLEVLGEA